MNKWIFLICILFAWPTMSQQEDRLQYIANQLEAISVDLPGLTENANLNLNAGSVSLSNFLLALAEVHRLNINTTPELQTIQVVNNFSEVQVSELLLFLCKTYQLDIDFTGSIMSFRMAERPSENEMPREIKMIYDPVSDRISMDLQQDPLHEVFRKFTDLTGRNLLFRPSIQEQPLRIYLKEVAPDEALDKIAAVHGLSLSKSRDGFFLFDRTDSQSADARGTTQSLLGNQDMYYEILDLKKGVMRVAFTAAPVSRIVAAICADLQVDYYMASPLDGAGVVTFRAESITFDELLTKIFESRTASSNESQTLPTNPESNIRNRGGIASPSPTENDAFFTFKKENGVYFFGKTNQLSVRKLEIIPMMYRSVELLKDPKEVGEMGRRAGRTLPGTVNYMGSGLGGFGGVNQGLSTTNASQRGGSAGVGSDMSQAEAQAILTIIPDELKDNLDIKVDYELNSFLVNGPAASIHRLREFIKQIDKPVSVVLIEVMILEVRNTSSVETGISWGIGAEAQTTQGRVFPETDLTLGANTVNKIIGGFDGFGSFNIGKVIPEFFATIKAMEQNGNIKIRSTPKLSTLNGHRAHLSIGETTYYVVTSQNFFGSQIPTASEIRNYFPIDAELAVSIKPLVSGNGQVTLDINVIQSDFSSERIEEEAPPGLTSREFSSIIRMQNQDVAILGGLEEKVKNDSGSGVPFLARVPVIKWLFSKRVREDSKQKLTILIKPTVIY